jgi:hypothetical protein
MFRRINELAMVCVVTILFCCAGLKASEQNAQAAQSSKPAMQAQQANQQNAAVNSNEENFSNARESFLKKDYKAAAKDIQKSVKFMKSETKHASAGGKKLLTSSINELEKLAKDINQGRVTTVNTLDGAFSHARNAIASNRQMKMMESKTKSAAAKTGNAIKDASSNLKHGVSWTVGKVGDAASVVVKDTGFVAGKVIEGGGWAGKHTGNFINSIFGKVESFGKNLQPKKQETMIQ